MIDAVALLPDDVGAAAVVPPMVLCGDPPFNTTPLPPPPCWPLPRGLPGSSTTAARVLLDPMIVPLTAVLGGGRSREDDAVVVVGRDDVAGEDVDGGRAVVRSGP